MTSADRQGHEEKIIFKEFAQSTSRPIKLDTIENRDKPEPDILCEIENHGYVAFEMVELVSQNFMRHSPVGGQQKLIYMLDEYKSGIADNFRDAVIRLDFHDTCTDGTKIYLVPEIIDLLKRLPVGYKGDILGEPEFQAGPLEKLINKLRPALLGFEVARGFKDCSFFVGQMVDADFDVLESLTKKFKQAYCSEHPIELLAYFLNRPPPERLACLATLYGCIQTNFAGSRFQRVWVYNHWKNEIMYVFPP